MLLLSIGSVFALRAQTSFHVDTLRSEGLIFPKVMLPGRYEATRQVERYLFIDLLGADPDTTEAGHLFDHAHGKGIPTLSDVIWEARGPAPGLLELEVTAEGCGAYCEGFTKHYHFDLRSGEALDDAIIFTAMGHDLLEDTLRKNWYAQLTGFIERAGSILYQDTLGGDERDALLETVGMYRRCLEEREMNGPYINGYVIEGDRLRFFTGRCATHAELPLDTLDPVSVSLPLVRCLPWMHERYRALFTGPD